MAREMHRLSARTVTTEKRAGYHADGNSLFLVVEATGSKRWSLIYRWGGVRREMGLGSAATVSLADARDRVADARRLMAQGIDPIDERKRARAAQKAASTTFGDFADNLVDRISTSFRNEKHIAQWKSTLATHAAVLRPKAIDQIDTEAILGVLNPIWQTTPETAVRLRARIERVLDAAAAAGLRTGDNPARWRGHLKSLLAAPQKLARGHHAAMPYGAVPAFIADLRRAEGVGALALEFATLTASRTGEVIRAKVNEFADLESEQGIWTVPPERMKAGREHRVPLVGRALEIARRCATMATSDYMFPGASGKSPISSATMTKALRTAKGEGTVHGLRSSFRDWCGEETTFDERIAEAALAHVVGDATERAYRRGDALAKRRQLMQAWCDYCTSTPIDKVVPMTPKRTA